MSSDMEQNGQMQHDQQVGDITQQMMLYQGGFPNGLMRIPTNQYGVDMSLLQQQNREYLGEFFHIYNVIHIIIIFQRHRSQEGDQFFNRVLYKKPCLMFVFFYIETLL